MDLILTVASTLDLVWSNWWSGPTVLLADGAADFVYDFRTAYMKTYGLTHQQLAMVAVVQREWAAKNPRVTFKAPITVEDVLSSRMIAYPFRLLQCCLVTDGGGALILVAAERARDFPQKLALAVNRGRSTCSAPARVSRPRWSPSPVIPAKAGI